MLKTTFLFFGFLLAGTLWSQRAFKCYVPLSLDAGIVVSKSISDSTYGWFTGIGKSLQVRAGLSTIYKERIGLRSQAGLFFFSIPYTKADQNYTIVTFYSTLSVTPYVLFPMAFKGSHLHFGCQMGNVFYDDDKLVNNNELYCATTISTKSRPRFYSPEIGITRIDNRISISILATYFYQNFKNPLVTTTITDQDGEFRGTGKGDYLGLRVDFAIQIGGRREKNAPAPLFVSPPDASEAFATRDNAVVKQIKTGRQYIKLRLYESGEIDNDTISVSVNGRYILANHNLEKKKVKLRIPLEKGTNTITVYAHNEGTLPPNTASCYIRYGFRKTTFPVSTSLKRNASVVIDRK